MKLTDMLNSYISERWHNLPEKSKILLSHDTEENARNFIVLLWEKQFWEALAERLYIRADPFIFNGKPLPIKYRRNLFGELPDTISRRIMTRFPVYLDHNNVACFRCGQSTHTPMLSGFGIGHGAYYQTCDVCQIKTWYDVTAGDGRGQQSLTIQ